MTRSNEEIQRDLAPLFRAQELQRRDAREKIILNHAALGDEQLTSEEQTINAEALASIARQRAEFEREVEREQMRLENEESELNAQVKLVLETGYWRRLWLALLGKDPT